MVKTLNVVGMVKALYWTGGEDGENGADGANGAGGAGAGVKVGLSTFRLKTNGFSRFWLKMLAET